MGWPVGELLRRMSSRELTEWMSYYTWKAHCERIRMDSAHRDAPPSDDFVMEMAWLAMGVSVVDDPDDGTSTDE